MNDKDKDMVRGCRMNELTSLFENKTALAI